MDYLRDSLIVTLSLNKHNNTHRGLYSSKLKHSPLFTLAKACFRSLVGSPCFSANSLMGLNQGTVFVFGSFPYLQVLHHQISPSGRRVGDWRHRLLGGTLQAVFDKMPRLPTSITSFLGRSAFTQMLPSIYPTDRPCLGPWFNSSRTRRRPEQR